jgi:hypothetical protein
VCAGSSARENLDIELDIDRGRRTVYADFLRTFDVPADGSSIHTFTVPGEAAPGSIARAELRERGTATGSVQIPMTIE